MSLSVVIQLPRPGIDVCFPIERNMEVVSVSADCKANNKVDIICILSIQIRNLQRYINPDGAIILRNKPLA